MKVNTAIDYFSLRKRAKAILHDNDRGSYTVPNSDVYPFQWNWDSFFVALGWLTFDEPRAWKEIEMLFEGQWENGMVPSIVFHTHSPHYFPGPDVWQVKSSKGIDTTGITQIPIVIFGTVMMYFLSRDRKLAYDKLSSLFSKLFLYQQWAYSSRKYRNTGLCKIYHGWESMDNSPMWDNALKRVTPTTTQFERKDTNNIDMEHRPKQWDYERYISIVEKLRDVSYDYTEYDKIAEMSVVDAAYNGILLAGNHALLQVVDEFGTDAQRKKLLQWAQETERDMSLLWDDRFCSYVDYDVLNRTHIREKVSGGLIPLFAGIRGANETHYRQTLQQWIAQNLPSVDTESEKFEPMRYWRGPSWTIMNFLIYYGCLRLRWNEEAQEIKERSLKQISIGGFYENFNPLTNEGGGGKHFSWTAASYLYWLDEGAYNFEILLTK